MISNWETKYQQSIKIVSIRSAIYREGQTKVYFSKILVLSQLSLHFSYFNYSDFYYRTGQKKNKDVYLLFTLEFTSTKAGNLRNSTVQENNLFLSDKNILFFIDKFLGHFKIVELKNKPASQEFII